MKKIIRYSKIINKLMILLFFVMFIISFIPGISVHANSNETKQDVSNDALHLRYNNVEAIKAINFDFDEKVILANHDIRLTYLDVLYSYYEQVINFTQDNNIDCDLTFKEFHDLYYENNMNLNEFVEGCINYLAAASLNSNFRNEKDLMNFEFTPTSSSSSGNQKWYYNIDDRGILKKPTYNNSVYNLLGSYI